MDYGSRKSAIDERVNNLNNIKLIPVISIGSSEFCFEEEHVDDDENDEINDNEQEVPDSRDIWCIYLIFQQKPIWGGNFLSSNPPPQITEMFKNFERKKCLHRFFFLQMS